MMKILYKTQATATGGRDGSAQTQDGRLSVKLNTPKELGGPGGDGTNPEQLFASGWSACFLGALKYVAAQSKIKLPDTTAVSATIGIGPRDDGKGFGISGDLEISIPGFARAQAEELVQKAHIVCPYSDATRGNIPVTLKVV